jgi:hypothetical protein
MFQTLIQRVARFAKDEDSGYVPFLGRWESTALGASARRSVCKTKKARDPWPPEIWATSAPV